MKQRVEEMEREANKLRELQAAAEKAERGSVEAADTSVPMETEEDKAAADGRSIFVGNARSFLLGFVTLSLNSVGFFAGRLRSHARGDSNALPGLWCDQSCHHPL